MAEIPPVAPMLPVSKVPAVSRDDHIKKKYEKKHQQRKKKPDHSNESHIDEIV